MNLYYLNIDTHSTPEEKRQFDHMYEAIDAIWNNIKVGQHCFYTDVYLDAFHHEVVSVDPEKRILVLHNHSLPDFTKTKIVKKNILPDQYMFRDSLEELKDDFEFPSSIF